MLPDTDMSLTASQDGHNDFPLLVRFLYNNHIYDETFTVPFEQGGVPLHVDLHRLRKGQQGGVFWSLFTPCPANGSDFSDENYAASELPQLPRANCLLRG